MAHAPGTRLGAYEIFAVSRSVSRRPARLVGTAVVLLFCSIAIAAVGLRTFIVFPRGWIQDDAFFYTQIAYNIGTRRLSSFDGVTLTNGYHLLWGWILSAVAFVVSFFTLSKQAHLIAMTAVYLWCVLFTCAAIGRNATERVALCASFLLVTVLMETTLLAIALLLIAEVYFKRQAPRWLVVVFFLVPWIRIDASLTAVIFAWTFAKPRRTTYVVSVIVGAICQMVSSRVLFGEFFSVVALIKTATVFDVFRNVGINMQVVLARTLVVGVLGLAALVAFSRVSDRFERFGAYVFSSATVLFVALHLLVNNAVREWYFTPCFVVITYLVFRVASGRSRLMYAAVLSSIVVLYVATKTVAVYRNGRAGVYAAAMAFPRQIDDQVPVGERVYMVDGSGFVGYFATRGIVDGDGLVNSFAYARALRAAGLRNYLVEQRIRYVATNGPSGPDGVIIDYRGLRVRRDDVDEVAVSDGHVPFAQFRLFRLKGR